MKNAMSPIGYAIVVVILVGVGMIISAPMLVNKYEIDKKNTNVNKEYRTPENDYSYLEERINSKIAEFEKRNTVSNKYVCSIEGKLDENGVVVNVDSTSSNEQQKFVFVCEYKE